MSDETAHEDCTGQEEKKKLDQIRYKLSRANITYTLFFPFVPFASVTYANEYSGKLRLVK